MKIKDIINEMEKLAPLSFADAHDNIGLLVGSADAECTGVIVSLDCSLDSAKQAALLGANLIIVHHPLIWNPLKSIDLESPVGKVLEVLIKNGINLYAAHTNLDSAEGGINSTLADMLGATKKRRVGIGYVAEFKKLKVAELAQNIASLLGDKSVKLGGNYKKSAKSAYIISGDGGDNETYEEAKKLADVFITGDIRHHLFVYASNDNYPVIEFSHHFSEIIACDIIFKHLKPVIGATPIKIANQHCPYRTLEEI